MCGTIKYFIVRYLIKTYLQFQSDQINYIDLI